MQRGPRGRPTRPQGEQVDARARGDRYHPGRRHGGGLDHQRDRQGDNESEHGHAASAAHRAAEQLDAEEADDGENRQPHQEPGSGPDLNGRIQRSAGGQPFEQRLSNRPEAEQGKAGDRHQAETADGVTVRPDDRPERPHPGEQYVAEVDHEPHECGEGGYR